MPNELNSLKPVINPAHLKEDIATLKSKIRQLTTLKECKHITNVHIFFNANYPDGSSQLGELTQNLLPFNLPQEMLIIIEQSIEFYCRQLQTYQQLLLTIEN
jgi:hypothetical protein